MVRALTDFLDHALARRRYLSAELVVMRRRNDKREIARIEFSIARLEGAIAFFVSSSTVH